MNDNDQQTDSDDGETQRLIDEITVTLGNDNYTVEQDCVEIVWEDGSKETVVADDIHRDGGVLVASDRQGLSVDVHTSNSLRTRQFYFIGLNANSEKTTFSVDAMRQYTQKSSGETVTYELQPETVTVERIKDLEELCEEIATHGLDIQVTDIEAKNDRKLVYECIENTIEKHSVPTQGYSLVFQNE